VHLLPGETKIDSGIPFMVLAAISAVEAIDTMPGLDHAAGIKWVNDILIEGAKVAGVLAYSEGSGKSVDAAVLGIGLNAETTPTVEGTPFVPSVSSLGDHADDPGSCKQSDVFQALLESLDRNYQLLLDGQERDLIERYRQRSVIIGRDVEVCSDDASSPPSVLARGRVRAIGDNLELHLDGHGEPVTRGRLILKSEV
jgi:BirA family biotin operon repressor/biotin-[acetyl-CoA-carboxylase] ligase